MKCSLLTLSTFIDDELSQDHRAEVDAHLVGCPRCSAGAATLREERTRVGQLARVHVDPESAQAMLEQVGIAVSAFDVVTAPAPAPPVAADSHRPWQGAVSSPALPWTPQRPSVQPIVPEPLDDAQPDLPLDGVRATPTSWHSTGHDGPEASPEVEAPGTHPSPSGDDPAATPPAAPAAPPEPAWATAMADSGAWELALPPPVDAVPAVSGEWYTGPLVPPVPAPPAVAVPPPIPPVSSAPPTRLAPASGPGALLARVRDAVGVRLALARHAGVDDAAQIVSGSPLPRATPLPLPVTAPVDVAAASVDAAVATHEPQATAAADATAAPACVSDDVLAGTAGPGSGWIDVIDHRASAPAPAPEEPAEWNAFAASSFPAEPATPPPSPAPKPLGRHSRAVARGGVPLSRRLGGGLAALAAMVTAAAGALTRRGRRAVAGVSAGGPDNRLLAGIAGIGLVFVVALLIGHVGSRPSTPTAARQTAGAASTTAPRSSAAPATSAPAATATPAPAAAVPVQRYGAGSSGFQVLRVRYGVHAGFVAVVFDLAASGASATGTPSATVAFSDPTTMLVTFTGAAPAGSTGTPPPGLIRSVQLISSNGQRAVYRFTLSRASSVSALYLSAPTRFVLELR